MEIHEATVEQVLWILFICISFCSFIPLLAGYRYSTESTSGPSLDVQLQQSHYIRMAFSSSITIFFPFMFEFIFILWNSKQWDLRSFVFNYRNRDVLLLYFIPDLYVLWIGIPNATTQFNFLYAFFLFRDGLLNAHFMKEIIIMGYPTWSNSSYLLIVLPLVLCNLFYSIGFAETLLSAEAFDISIICIMCVVSYSFVVIIINTIRWYRYVRIANVWNKNDQCCAVHIFMYYLYIIISWGITFEPKGTSTVWSSIMGEGFYSYYTCTTTLCFLVNYFIVNHLNKLYEAQAILDNKRAFVRDISHEMRTPLNCVTLGLDILLESKDISPEKRHEYLLDVRQSVTVAVQTLNELLMYDKIESDTLKVDKTTASVLELLETIKTFSLSMISASINFSHNIADVEEELSKFVIDGDLHKLNQVLRNILSNAIKFTPKGGCIAVLVELYEASSDRAMFAVTRYNINSTDILKFNRLKISCTDTGPGISKDNQKKLFKSIVQFNPHILQNGGGSGLGLFISDKIMELHEGSMSVHSEGEGKGSTFAITLPITFQSDAPALSTKRTSSSKPLINLSDSGMITPIDESSLLLHETTVTYDGVLSKTLVTILIVDDSAMNRKMISRLFTSSDEFEYNLLEACNGQEGVEAVLGDAESNRIDKIDVILMDNQMPVMDGVTAVNLLRKGGFANLIVMISGDSMNSDSVSMSGCGANHVMLKPIRKDVLFDMIRSFIRDK